MARTSTDYQTKATIDHNKIRAWAGNRGGRPATVRATGGEEEPGLLRIEFDEPREGGSLEEVSWEAFFEQFEEDHLAFVYQDELKEGGFSRFCKFVDRDKLDEYQAGS